MSRLPHIPIMALTVPSAAAPVNGNRFIGFNDQHAAAGAPAQGISDYDAAPGDAFAVIRDAIGDGAIKGISAAMQKALRSSNDIDQAVAEALKVRELENYLGGIADGYTEELRAFEAAAKERLRIGQQYGFDLVALEKRNAEDRAKLVDDILADRIGSLKTLLEDLNFGDLAEGTLADRRRRLQDEVAQAERAASAGEDGAADRLATLNRQLIELSREAFGTAGGEYGADRAQAIASANRIIDLEKSRLGADQDDLKIIFDKGNQLTDETNGILADIRAGIQKLGGNAGGSTYGFPRAQPTTREVAL